jgi:hypothetical protein
MTGRDGQIGQDGDLLVHQSSTTAKRHHRRLRGRTPARLVSDPTESVTWTHAPTATRPTARRRGGTGGVLARARAAIRSVTCRCDAGVRTAAAPNVTRPGSTVVR